MKKALPIILLAGAALVFLAMRKKKKGVTVEVGPTEKLTEEQFYAAQPTLLDKAVDVVKNVFTKTPQQKAGAQARKIAVKRAVATKTATKKQAQAVTKALQKPAFFKGIDDDSVLC